MKKRIYVGAGASALIAIVALAALTSGAIARTSATPLPASSCQAIQNGSGQYLIASDLPLQGASRRPPAISRLWHSPPRLVFGSNLRHRS